MGKAQLGTEDFKKSYNLSTIVLLCLAKAIPPITKLICIFNHPTHASDCSINGISKNLYHGFLKIVEPDQETRDHSIKIYNTFIQSKTFCILL